MKVFVAIVMFLFMPACAMFFLGAYSRKEKTKTGFLYLISVIATAVVTLVLAKGIHPEWTIYEVSACAGITAIVLTLAVALFSKRIKFSVDIVLRTICFISIVTAVYSILTYGQATLDSDTAMVSMLNKCRLDHRSMFPESWYYANGDVAQIYGVNTYTTTLPFMLLLNNQSLARMLGSALYLLPVIFGLYYLSKRVFKDNSWLLAAPLILVFITGQLNITLYQSAYIGHVFTMGIMTSLLFERIVMRKKAPWVFYFILSTLGFTGAMRFFAENAIPMVGAVLFLMVLYQGKEKDINWKNYKKELLIGGSIMLSSMIIGQGFYRWLASWCNANNTSNNAMLFVGSLGECYQNLITYLTNHFACFGYSGNVSMISFRGIINLLSIGVCFVICFVIPIMQFKKIREESAGVRFFFAFGVIHNAVLMIINVFTSLVDYPPRYVMSSVYVCVIISCRYAYVNWFQGRDVTKVLWTGILSAATVLECVCLLSLSSGWKATLSSKKALNQTIIEHGMTKGYATYWNAYNNGLYSDFALSYGGVEIADRGFVKQLWLVDSDVFLPTAEKSFLMLTEGENQGAVDAIENQFGTPAREIEQNGMHIYFFDYDIASKLKEKNSFTPTEFFINEAASYAEQQIVIKDGGIVFGPAVFIEAGEYEVIFSGDNLDICEYDIHSNSAQNGIVYTEECRTGHEIKGKLTILYNIHDMEFRTWNNQSSKEIVFSGVRLVKPETGK